MSLREDKKMTMTYEEVTQEILSAPRFKKVPSVVNMKQYLTYLGHPEKEFKIIHVAGTNGKGSTCSFLESILRQHKKLTGLFTSPHLVDMRERMQIGREIVDKETFVDVYFQVKQVQKESGFPPLTFFELILVMALLIFKKKKVEYAIIEAGMGGKSDATNALSPVLSIITAVGMDHMQYLGETLSDIAKEKAGIMKAGVPCIFVDHETTITDIFEKQAKENMTPLLRVSEDSIKLNKMDGKVIDFSIDSRYYINSSLSVRSKGAYQAENGAVAAVAAKTLFPKMTDSVIESGLFEAFWPGRMEEIEEGIIVDGAHNEPSIKAFMNSVKLDKNVGSRILVFAVAADKDYNAMAKDLLKDDCFDTVILTRIPYERMEDPSVVRPVFEQYTNVRLYTEESMEKAYEMAVSMRRDEDLIYMAGSLYFIGALKEYLSGNLTK